MKIKLPICIEDILKDELCENCKEKLKKGIIDEKDVEYSKKIYKILKKYKVEDVEIVKFVETNDVIGILAKGNISALIGRQGVIIREIIKQFNKKIRVVSVKSEEDSVKDVLGKVKVLLVSRSLNKNKIKIYVAKNTLQYLPFSIESGKRLLEKALKKEVEFKVV